MVLQFSNKSIGKIKIFFRKCIKNYYRIVKFELYEIYVFLAYIFVQDYTLL